MECPMECPKAWVLWWRYSDGSGIEIIRTYTDGQRATEDFDLVKTDTVVKWHLDEVPFFE